ncbi:lipoprotein LpqV [Mycobacterium barrassiae]|uniref:lipoprotein LpqV n=1 Tax=Mycobacterium barrassiae TaxID=319709 RepID=UPI002265B8E2|nr:lipoprotein LpqV [Mycobacterium barrassiae]MCV7301657.1 lipoprotein LpqV [Mycobacterium barrassiae]
MSRHSRRAVGAAALVIVAMAVGTGCSSGTDTSSGPDAGPTTPAPAETTTTTSETPTAAPGEVAVSPDGVTTAVGAPADSTEDEYFKACKAARDWMQQQGGDAKAQLEPYLKNVQASDAPGPGTFDTPWSQLPPPRQAAVIVAAQAAADALCG